MASTNSSYIDESSDFEELWEILDKRHIYGLVAEDDDEVVEDESTALSGDQLGRLNRALNWGKDRIYNGLSEKYDLSSVTSSNAPEEIKEINARYAQFLLEKRRFRNQEATTEEKEEIDADVIKYAREKTTFKLDIARNAAPIAVVSDSKATHFDDAGQFDSIIPSNERDDVWPDDYNE